MSEERAKAPERVTVPLTVAVFPDNTYFLRVAVGTATDKETGEETELSTGMDDSPLIGLPDGQFVSFSWQALINAAVEAGKTAKGSVGADDRAQEAER